MNFDVRLRQSKTGSWCVEVWKLCGNQVSPYREIFNFNSCRYFKSNEKDKAEEYFERARKVLN